MQFSEYQRKPIIILAFLAAAFIFAGCQPAATPLSISRDPVAKNRMPPTSLPPGPPKPIDELSWKVFEGQTETIGDMRGKVLVLDFWATYCAPCIEEIPHLNQLQAKYGAKGFQVIGLHVGGDEDRPRIPAFVKRLGIDYPLAVPEDSLIYQLLRTDSRIPQTLVFDREGRLLRQFVSYDERIKKEIDLSIEEAMNAE